MRYQNVFFVMSVAVCGVFFASVSNAALKPTGFPQTFQDVSFTQRMQKKAEGYEPYKNASAYAIPEFKETDDDFKKAMCERDREECCRRWPDYQQEKNGKIIFSCQPTISYEKYGGNIDDCQRGKDETTWTAPKFYYTDRGATISCIPTRDNSEFIGWCPTSNITNCEKSTDCPKIQTIPVGTKDNKTFWACWKCVDPATKKGDQCVCPEHMQTTEDGIGCECKDTFVPDPKDPKKCVCKAGNKAQISTSTGLCECRNKNLDIQTDCTEPLVPCTDKEHMDPVTCTCPDGLRNINGFCQCVDNYGDYDPNQLMLGSGRNVYCECKDGDLMEKDDNGRCKCKDDTINIDRYPKCEKGTNNDDDDDVDGDDGGDVPPKTSRYKLVQCRALSRKMNGYLDGTRYNNWFKKYVPSTSVLNTALDCSKSTQDSIDKCFTPCSKSGVTDDGRINKELKDIIPDFCSGNRNRNSHVNFFSSKTNASESQYYTKTQVDNVLQKLDGTNFSECTTDRSWYIIAFHVDDDDNIKYYTHIQIGD